MEYVWEIAFSRTGRNQTAMLRRGEETKVGLDEEDSKKRDAGRNAMPSG
jgi:hypothetical protein